jgi:hypothetical protein
VAVLALVGGGTGCGRDLKADFASQPASGFSGDALGEVVVEVRERGKRVEDVPVAVSVALVGAGGTLEGTTTVLSSGGRAVFADLRVVGATSGARLEASAREVKHAVRSEPFDVRALHARFEGLPGATLPGRPLPPLRVQLVDAEGRPVTGTQRTVRLALGANPTGAVLGGPLEAGTLAGAAGFEGLRVDRPGEGLTLVATGAGFRAESTPLSAAWSLVEREPADRTAPGAPLNDTPAQAEALPLGVPFFGSLAESGGRADVDHLRLRARAGELLTVAAYANRLDEAAWTGTARLRLLGPDGAELYRVGARELGLVPVDLGLRAVRLPAEGEYVLALDAEAYDGAPTGARYALLASLGGAPPALQLEQEPAGQGGGNDTPATAEPLQPGLLAAYHEALGVPGAPADSDHYRLEVSAPTRLHLELVGQRNGLYVPGAGAGAGGGGGGGGGGGEGARAFDARLELTDAGGRLLWSNDDTTWFDPAVDYLVSAPGVYTLRVTRFGGGAAPYLLDYRAEAVTPRDAPASATPARAAPLAYGDYVAGGVPDGATPAYFRVAGRAGELVRLHAFDAAGWTGGAAAVRVTLMDAEGASPLAHGTGGEGRLARTILQRDGDFLVRVSAASATPFVLHAERFAAGRPEAEGNDPAPDGASPASPFDAQGWATGALSTPADRDAFGFSAEAGQLVSVSLYADNGLADGAPSLSSWGSTLTPALQVLDAAGTVLAATTFARTGEPDHAESLLRPLPMLEVSLRAPAAGDYRVVVSDAAGLGTPTAFYALQLWRDG